MGPQPLSSVGAVGFMVVTTPLSFVFPTFVMHNMVRRIAKGDWRSPANGSVPDTDASKLLATRQTMLIVGLASSKEPAISPASPTLLEGNVLARWAVVVGLSLQIARFRRKPACETGWTSSPSEWLASGLSLDALCIASIAVSRIIKMNRVRFRTTAWVYFLVRRRLECRSC